MDERSIQDWMHSIDPVKHLVQSRYPLAHQPARPLFCPIWQAWFALPEMQQSPAAPCPALEAT